METRLYHVDHNQLDPLYHKTPIQQNCGFMVKTSTIVVI